MKLGVQLKILCVLRNMVESQPQKKRGEAKGVEYQIFERVANELI